MSDSIITPQLLQEYALRRQNAMRENESYLAQLYHSCPELKSIEGEAKNCAYMLGAYTADTAEHEGKRLELHARIAELEKSKCELLAKLSIDPKDLEPKFACSLCNDTGFVGYPVRTPCVCIKQRAIELRYSTANVIRENTFESFDESVFKDEAQRKTMCRYRDIALKYADSLPNPSLQNLVLFGEVGLGKTFLLNCIVNAAIERELTVVNVTAYTMINAIVSSFKSASALPDFLSCDLLAIDDLGSEPMMTNVTREYLFNIINERLLHKKPMVIATNLDLESVLLRYEARTFSRLVSPQSGTLLEFTGVDIRLQRNNRRC